MQGTIEGADISYDVGYLINGKYSYLQKNLSDDSMDYSVAAGESGDFYWCITNRAECAVSFSGTVQYDSNDLVYRFYGNDVISVDSSCTIRLESIQVLLGAKEVKNICIYHYEENETKQFTPETREFRIEQKGTYAIFAVMEDGETVSLNQNVSVGYEVNNVIIEDGNDGKTAPHRGKYM